MHHLQTIGISSWISDSFASSIYVSLAYFSYTHTQTHSERCNWSPHPQLILLHLNQNKQPRGDKMLLFCHHLILLSIILISLCLTRLLNGSGNQQNYKIEMVKQLESSKGDLSPVSLACFWCRFVKVQKPGRLWQDVKSPESLTKNVQKSCSVHFFLCKVENF